MAFEQGVAKRRAASLGAAWLAVALWPATAGADDVVVMPSGAFTAPFEVAAPWFERRTGHRVTGVFGAGKPDSLAANLASALDLAVSRRGGEIVLSRQPENNSGPS